MKSETYVLELQGELAKLRAELATLKAEIVRKDEALHKCCEDIEFWNEVLDKEWRNFDGQLNTALNQARVALSPTAPKEEQP